MFQFQKNEIISDVILIKPQVFGDERGFFMETYNQRDFVSAGIDESFAQDSHSLSQKGVLRGFHLQIDKVQSKLVRVVKGSVLDFAIDLRKQSPTYGKYITQVLSGKNKKQLYVPKGFAHGFLTLEDDTELLYKRDRLYAPECERGLIYDDPNLAIDWESIKEEYGIVQFIVSAKDQKNMTLKEFESENPF